MKTSPSMDQWLKEAKSQPDAPLCGMYLTHNGVVRSTAKAMVREGVQNTQPVISMDFSYDAQAVEKLVQETLQMDGIYFVKTWLNEGHLKVGDDIMYVMIGGDIRPHIIDALQFLVGSIKNHCVVENESYDS